MTDLTRRAFLRRSALVGAGIVVAPVLEPLAEDWVHRTYVFLEGLFVPKPETVTVYYIVGKRLMTADALFKERYRQLVPALYENRLWITPRLPKSGPQVVHFSLPEPFFPTVIDPAVPPNRVYIVPPAQEEA